MREEKFIKENSTIWTNLENKLLKLKSKSFKSFDNSELESFISEYKKVCGHLSYCQTYFGDSETTEYLNKLVCSAHGYIYSTSGSNFKKIIKFYLKGFPELLQKYWGYLASSTALFLLGAIFSFILIMITADNAPVLIPQGLIDGVKNLNNGTNSWDSAIESSSIFTNNIKVGFLAFILGITLHIGTSYVLIFNGFILGGAAAIAIQNNVTVKFWSLILPHGVLELFCIFVCGAAGLIIGQSIIHPKHFSRKDSLIKEGKAAVYLVCGTIPLFVVAGIIEGYFTPSSAPDEWKLLFSILSFVAILLYLASPLLFKKQKS